jgi:hypothetical protein
MDTSILPLAALRRRVLPSTDATGSLDEGSVTVKGDVEVIMMDAGVPMPDTRPARTITCSPACAEALQNKRIAANVKRMDSLDGKMNLVEGLTMTPVFM